MKVVFLVAEAPIPQEFGMLVVRMMLFLALILVLIYVVLRKGLPMLMHVPGFRNRTVKILERVPVDQKRSLLVVEVQDRVYLLGSAEGQINVLMQLDREKMNAQPAVGEKTSGLDDRLKKVFLKPKPSDSST